jgi:hypothetical protein
MKKTLLFASILCAFGCVAAIAAQFAGVIPLHVRTLPFLLGAAMASGLAGVVVSDYSRRPRVRVRRRRNPATRVKAAASPPAKGRGCDWTYLTRPA